MIQHALHKIGYGLYVISSIKDGKKNGQIANTINQVTAEPAQVMVALNKLNLTHDFVHDSEVFSASILSQITPMEMIGQFGFHSGRDIDKFKGIEFITGETGVPIVTDYSVAFLEAKVVKTIDVGTHTIFVGEVIDSQILNDHEPMTYAYYHQIKGGKSPKNAPTYIMEEPVTEGSVGKYRCNICGFVYDPQGDDSQGAFEELADDWKCPICGAGKSSFEKVN